MFACLFNCQLICLGSDKQVRGCIRGDTCVQEDGSMCSCKSFILGSPCVGTAEESLECRVDLLPEQDQHWDKHWHLEHSAFGQSTSNIIQVAERNEQSKKYIL